MYEPVIATAKDRDHALEWVARTLPAIRAALLALDPEFDAHSRPPRKTKPGDRLGDAATRPWRVGLAWVRPGGSPSPW